MALVPSNLLPRWVPGSKVVYVRNPDYVPRSDGEPGGWWQGSRSIGEWFYIPDQSTAQAALSASELDHFERPHLDLMPLLESDPNITVAFTDPLGNQSWLRPNHLHPPFNNVKARQALLWMVNQADYMRAVAGDPKFWRTCAAYFMCGTPLETDAGAPGLTQNLDKAR